MKLRICISIFLLGLVAWGLPLSGQSPNWAEDAAPVLYENCVSCHRPGGIGQFSLIGYQNAYVNRFSIDFALADGSMPPWPPDPDYRRFAHERTLTNGEVQSLRDWIASGAPPGDTTLAPTPPSAAPPLPNPDLTIRMDPYVSQASTVDEYRCFSLPTGLSQDQFISAIEVAPGNLGIVHHVMVFQDTSGLADSLQNQNPDPGFSCFGQGFGAELLFFWTPGSGPVQFPAGTGMKLHKDADLIVQVHYPLGSAGQVDSTAINFRFSPDPNPREVHIAPFLNAGFTLQNGPLFIPADSIRTFNAQFFVGADISLLAVLPHAHYLGKSMQVLATKGPTDSIPLIRIPDWDVAWQGAYMFQYLQKIEAGSRLRTQFTYDNTAANPNNPSSPPQDVSEGEAATDEMLFVYFWYLDYQPGDEEVLLDSTLLTGVPAPMATPHPTLKVLPNPAKENVTIKIGLHRSGKVELQLLDLLGRPLLAPIVEQLSSGANRLQCSLASLPSGVYFLRVSTPQGILSKKLLVE